MATTLHNNGHGSKELVKGTGRARGAQDSMQFGSIWPCGRLWVKARRDRRLHAVLPLDSEM